MRFGRNKYKVSSPDRRRYKGRTYASMAEMEYARMLDMLKEAGEIHEIIHQPIRIWNDGDSRYIPDFYVVYGDEREPEFIDVKGMETPAFKKSKNLWTKHETSRLVIVVKSGKGWKIKEVISPKETAQ